MTRRGRRPVEQARVCQCRGLVWGSSRGAAKTSRAHAQLVRGARSLSTLGLDPAPPQEKAAGGRPRVSRRSTTAPTRPGQRSRTPWRWTARAGRRRDGGGPTSGPCAPCVLAFWTSQTPPQSAESGLWLEHRTLPRGKRGGPVGTPFSRRPPGRRPAGVLGVHRLGAPRPSRMRVAAACARRPEGVRGVGPPAARLGGEGGGLKGPDRAPAPACLASAAPPVGPPPNLLRAQSTP